MKKQPALATKLPFHKERITRLSLDDLDKIVGGFQVETPEHSPTSHIQGHLSPPLGGHSALTQYNSGLHL